MFPKHKLELMGNVFHDIIMIKEKSQPTLAQIKTGLPHVLPTQQN
jgi:hypothetical protein